MKKLIIVLLLVFSFNLSAQEKSSEKCVKVTENNKCTNVITVRSYLVTEWNRIQAEKRKKRKKKAKKQ